MEMSEFELKKINRLVKSFCDKRSRVDGFRRCDVTYRVFDNEVWMFERHQSHDGGECIEFAFARASCDLETRLWTLFKQDESRGWQAMGGVSPTRNFAQLLSYMEPGGFLD